VRAGAVIGAEVAIWRGTGVDQVIVPLLEFKTTRRALIGCVNHCLPPRTAAIGFGHVEMNYVLARADRVGRWRLVVDVLNLYDMA
jgi:hypothetical protein